MKLTHLPHWKFPIFNLFVTKYRATTTPDNTSLNFCLIWLRIFYHCSFDHSLVPVCKSCTQYFATLLRLQILQQTERPHRIFDQRNKFPPANFRSTSYYSLNISLSNPNNYSETVSNKPSIENVILVLDKFQSIFNDTSNKLFRINKNGE